MKKQASYKRNIVKIFYYKLILIKNNKIAMILNIADVGLSISINCIINIILLSGFMKYSKKFKEAKYISTNLVNRERKCMSITGMLARVSNSMML